MLSINEILEVIRAVDQSAISRLELEQEKTRLVIIKGANDLPPAPVQAAEPVRAAVSTAEDLPVKPAAAVGEEKYHQVLAPMLGTFYAAPEPGAPAFVQVGQIVDTGTAVCVLEAMKLFNEVEAGMAGEIMEVLVKDGEFVEYGQPLFRIKPK